MRTGGFRAWALLAGLSLAGVACGSSHRSDDDDTAGHSAAGIGTGGDAGSSAAGGGKAGRGSTGGTGGDGTTGGTGEGGATGGTGGDLGGGTGGGGTGGSAVGGTGGGSSGTGGFSGTTVMTGGQTGTLPSEPSGFVPVGSGAATDKLDLLLMIDNSISMFQKQVLLSASVPFLMRHLAQPDCVDELGDPTGEHADENGECAGGEPELPAVRDLHVGIITSSLGDHGSSGGVCSVERSAMVPGDSNADDLAELLPSVRAGLTSWNDSGFLLWDPRDQGSVDDPHSPLGTTETELGEFTSAFTAQLAAVGEHGCGYEGSLEAWYRFLIDPTPVLSMGTDTTTSASLRGDTNIALLAQRSAFLRPDSAVAIVMMSDENDCSILDEDGTQGWLVGYMGGTAGPTWHMPRSSTACASDPNDPCCYPCAGAARSGCPSADAACPSDATLPINEDSMNMRCFDQKRRFGIDLLYPTGRYVEALTSPTVRARPGGVATPNPLFPTSGGLPQRDPSSVVLMGIVGVPWQDLSLPASWDAARDLTYSTAAELASEGRWDVVLGSAASNGVPTDTLMVESIDARLAPLPQQHPLLPEVTVGAVGATTNTNPINGHEQAVLPIRDDLQMACIFPLPKPVACTDANAAACDCNYDDFGRNSPLCTGAAPEIDGTQIAGKAYPSRRELDVLRGIGDQAVVTSICPKNVTPNGDPTEDPTYAYNPGMSALVRRLKPALAPSCLVEELRVSDVGAGGTPCHLLELAADPSDSCDCSALDRTDPADVDLAKARQHLRARGLCASDTTCDAFCVCEIPGLVDQALERCRNDQTPDPADTGFCYVDTDNGVGSATLVRDCPAGQKRSVRFIGTGAPDAGASVFAACDD